MRHFFIDLENVRSYGLEGVLLLKPEDMVYVFYSDNANTLTIPTIESLNESPATVKYIKTNYTGANAMDFQIVTLLGATIERDKTGSFYIISHDNGFKSAVRFCEGYFTAYDIVTGVFANIIIAINSEKNPKAAATENEKVNESRKKDRRTAANKKNTSAQNSSATGEINEADSDSKHSMKGGTDGADTAVSDEGTALGAENVPASGTGVGNQRSRRRKHKQNTSKNGSDEEVNNSSAKESVQQSESVNSDDMSSRKPGIHDGKNGLSQKGNAHNNSGANEHSVTDVMMRNESAADSGSEALQNPEVCDGNDAKDVHQTKKDRFGKHRFGRNRHYGDGQNSDSGSDTYGNRNNGDVKQDEAENVSVSEHGDENRTCKNGRENKKSGDRKYLYDVLSDYLSSSTIDMYASSIDEGIRLSSNKNSLHDYFRKKYAADEAEALFKIIGADFDELKKKSRT